MRMVTWGFLALGMGSAHGVTAQSLEQWVAWGDAAMERGEHYGASRFYAGALAMDAGRMSIQWKQAEACRSSHQYDKAAELYERVFYKDQGRTHADALRWLGEMQLSNGEYDAAEVTWDKVLQREKKKTSVVAQRARNAIAGCAIGRAAMNTVPEHAPEHLPRPVNTFDSEFGARIGPDSALYFSSLRGDLNDHGEVIDTAAYHTVLLRATPQGSEWKAGEPLPDPVNGIGHNGNAAWTLDGRYLLFTRCVAGIPCRIHIAPIQADGFGEAIPLAGLGEAHSTQPMVVRWEDQETLFFVSDRSGGSGGMDIWKAHLTEGRAVDVHPLPGAVNTPGNETGPWLDAATSTLWFSSDFHPGMGGYDIFSSRLENDLFGTPEHAGVPLNSPANDLYPAFHPQRNEAWFTSNRKGSFAAKGETCCNDLYRLQLGEEPVAVVEPVPMPEPEVTPGADSVTTAVVHHMEQLRRKLPLTLYFQNDRPEPRSWSETTQQTYQTTYQRYRDALPEYAREGGGEAIHDFFRNEVDRGLAQLDELIDGLIATLQAGIPVSLSVRGHASPLARSDYNANLSMRRIESLRNELRTTHAGALRAYMEGTTANGATLTVKALPFGEDHSVQGVSDDLQDLERSVYSVAAARERRIHIEAIELFTGGAPAVEYQKRTLGKLKQDQERTVTFTIRNQGREPLRLLDSKAECGCTTAELPQGDIPPGGEVPVEIHFNGRAPIGPLDRTVTIRTNGRPERIELTIEGEMVP